MLKLRDRIRQEKEKAEGLAEHNEEILKNPAGIAYYNGRASAFTEVIAMLDKEIGQISDPRD